MKNVLIFILIGLVTAFVGWIVAAFLVEILFTGTSRETGSIFGWGMYLSLVIVVCTGLIIENIRKPKNL